MIVIKIKTWKDWKNHFLDWVKEPRQETCIMYCNCMKVSAEEKTSIAIDEYVKKHGLTNDQQKELDYIISKEIKDSFYETRDLIKKCQPKKGI